MTERRPLEGLPVGLSASGDEKELERKGFSDAGLNRVTARFSQALLAAGARLVFGHDWRNAGIMRSIAGAAVDYRLQEDAGPSILNFVPWPDPSRADPDLLQRLADVLRVEPGGLPPELLPLEQELASGGEENERRRDLRLYLRAQGLAWMRRRLTSACRARVLLGGKTSGFEGRYPGLAEEALLALQAGQPIYLVGLLGGLSEMLGRMAVGEETARPRSFGVPRNADLLRSVLRRWDQIGETSADDPMDLRPVWQELVQKTREALFTGETARNGLSPQENRQLLSTTIEEEALYLVLKGLRRVFPPAP